MRWLVKGSDVSSGQAVEQVFSADNMAQAEAFAQISGIAVASTEQLVELGAVDATGDPLAAIAAAASTHRPMGLPYARKATGGAVGGMKDYKARVGTVSFACQVALLSWTVLFVGLACLSFISGTIDMSRNAHRDIESAGTVAGIIGSWVCLFIAWAVGVVPLGIAAMVAKREF